MIYLRVSTEEQARKGFSLPSQQEACRTRAREIAREAETAVQIQEFVDTFGGDVLERPVLEEMRSFIREKRPDWFICMDPDRFSRSLAAQLLVTDEIERAGTRLAFVQHNYEKTAEGRLFYQLRGAVAEFEKAKILERTARGKRRKLRDGRRSNGVAPYGYRHDVATDELEIYEPEARWVRLIFQWVADEHLPYYQIVRRLRELGVPTKRGGTWREATVAYILKNTTYVGQMICNRYDSVGKSAYRRLPRAKREPMTHRERPETDWITASVPALIDRGTFDTVQRLLATYVRRGGPRNGHLLSMLLRCGRCGSGMAYNRKCRGSNYIRCNRRFADLRNYADSTRCTMPHIRVDAVENGVWEVVCNWLLDPGLLGAYQAVPDTDRGRHLAAEIAALEAQLAEKHSEQKLIIRKQMKLLLTEKTADALLAATATQIAQIESKLADTRRRSCQEPVSPRSQAARHSGTAELLTRLDHGQRGQLIRQVVRAVTVNEDGTWTISAY
ncbi:MAG TPA: recombinase family protein [Symbiobacteriaceae bacterium]|nr:recombinase family protein [Symbiobacteriaceae bacterium]